MDTVAGIQLSSEGRCVSETILWLKHAQASEVEFVPSLLGFLLASDRLLTSDWLLLFLWLLVA